MNDLKNQLKDRKTLVSLLVLLLLAIALPLGIKLAKDQQILRSRAAADPIRFTGENVQSRGSASPVPVIVPNTNNEYQVDLEFNAPSAPPSQP